MRDRPAPADGFARLVHQILVVEKRRPVRDVAAALGMDYANFQARLMGRVRFRPIEIVCLLHELPDQRLCDYLLQGSPYVAVPRPDPSAAAPAHDASALQSAGAMSLQCAISVAKISDAVSNGGLQPSEIDELRSHLMEAERALLALRAKLPQLLRRCGYSAAGRPGTENPPPQQPPGV